MKGTSMNSPHAGSARAPRSSRSIQGQLLRLSEHRAVAIYLREGSTWVADFVDGQGVLIDVETWVRFNCGTPTNPHASRRIARESAIPLSTELSAQIESLHQPVVSRRRRTLAQWVDAIFAAFLQGRLAMLVAHRFHRRISLQTRSAR
jgi:hypothetical protein